MRVLWIVLGVPAAAKPHERCQRRVRARRRDQSQEHRHTRDAGAAGWTGARYARHAGFSKRAEIIINFENIFFHFQILKRLQRKGPFARHNILWQYSYIDLTSRGWFVDGGSSLLASRADAAALRGSSRRSVRFGAVGGRRECLLGLVLVADMMAGWCDAMLSVCVFVDAISCSRRRQRPCEAPSLR